MKAAIKQKDARLLYSIDIEYVRNYGEVCDWLYCAEHWKIMPIMNDDWCDGFVWTCSRGISRSSRGQPVRDFGGIIWAVFHTHPLKGV
jgi:hypothetical protein